MSRQGTISETLFRQWQLLRLVPRGPRKIDAATLERLLREEGIDVHRRSIQRDLESLATSFTALVCDVRSKPYGWSWDKDAPVVEIPPMNVSTAVTLDLVRAHTVDTLPRSTLRTLAPYFDRAREVLEDNAGTRLARWPKKVRVIPRGQPLHPPDVAADVLDVVYAALLEERRFTAQYRPRGTAKARDYEVNPLGLVVRSGTLVLVCTFRDYADVNHVVLHRMSRAALLDAPARVPPGFDLDAHIGDGGVAFRRGAKLRLRARLRAFAAITLREAPLGRDQRLSPCDDEHELLEVTVADTLELRGWILAYGPLLEVLEPKALRDEIANTLRQAAERYAE